MCILSPSPVPYCLRDQEGPPSAPGPQFLTYKMTRGSGNTAAGWKGRAPGLLQSDSDHDESAGRSGCRRVLGAREARDGMCLLGWACHPHSTRWAVRRSPQPGTCRPRDSGGRSRRTAGPRPAWAAQRGPSQRKEGRRCLEEGSDPTWRTPTAVPARSSRVQSQCEAQVFYLGGLHYSTWQTVVPVTVDPRVTTRKKAGEPGSCQKPSPSI